jgi:hypothetical protein
MNTSPAQQTIAGPCDRVASAASIQQAENPAVEGARFRQDSEPNYQKQRHKLRRVPFEVSQLMEFCSLRELQNQTGHDVWDWPLVVLMGHELRREFVGVHRRRHRLSLAFVKMAALEVLRGDRR